MKLNQILYFFLVIILLAGCDDDLDFNEQLEVDKGIIEDYVADQGLVGEWTERGVFYTMDKEGTGTEYPTVTSSIEIIYEGTLMDGTVFDSSEGFPRTLIVYQLIQGWQEGILKYKKGSKGTMIIPSGLAYGIRGRGSIPGNAVLRFEIELLSFQ